LKVRFIINKDVDFSTVRKNRPIYVPKIASRHQALNFDKTKITDKPLAPERDSGAMNNMEKPTKKKSGLPLNLIANLKSQANSSFPRRGSDQSQKSFGSGSNIEVLSKKSSSNVLFFNNDYIGSSENVVSKKNSKSSFAQKNEEKEDFSTKRDDLLHKKNIDCITDCFKKCKEKNFDIFGVDKMLFDLNWEES